MIKAAFFDVDRTLFSSAEKGIPASTLQAIASMQKRGILCVMATGRNWSSINPQNFYGACFDAFITVNGHFCFDRSLKPFFSKPLEGLEPVLAVFAERSIPLMIVEDFDLYFNLIDDRVRGGTLLSPDQLRVGEYSGNRVYQVTAYIDPCEDEALASRLPGFKVLRWGPWAADIVNEDIDKVVGVREYIRQQGIRPDEIIAFGDSDNDVEMIRYAGIGVAMGNANQNARDAADYVTRSVDDDGVVHALRHFGLI